jgi:hypothetical protein
VAPSCYSDNGSKLPGRVTILYRPVDRFSLRFEGGKDVVAVIFDYIIFDSRSASRTVIGRSFALTIFHVLTHLMITQSTNGKAKRVNLKRG